jgi:hypothetical protein
MRGLAVVDVATPDLPVPVAVVDSRTNDPTTVVMRR